MLVGVGRSTSHRVHWSELIRCSQEARTIYRQMSRAQREAAFLEKAAHKGKGFTYLAGAPGAPDAVPVSIHGLLTLPRDTIDPQPGAQGVLTLRTASVSPGTTTGVRSA